MIIRLVHVIAHFGNVIIVVMNGLHPYLKEQEDRSVQIVISKKKNKSMCEFNA